MSKAKTAKKTKPAKKLSKKEKQRLELFIILAVVIFSILIWDTIILYPVKLFVVLLHEISHGIAAVLTGGKIVSIEIFENLGGQCLTSGGVSFVVASAGYLGSLCFGSLLFLSAYNKKIENWSTYSIAFILIFFAANYMVGSIGILLALSFSFLLIISSKYFNQIFHRYFIKILGIISSFYVLVDIKEDLLTFAYRETDAHLLAKISGIAAPIWGFLWFLISVVVVYFLFKYGFKKGYSKK